MNHEDFKVSKIDLLQPPTLMGLFPSRHFVSINNGRSPLGSWFSAMAY